MARPIRVEYPDAVYHVTARGNQGNAIYRDREQFLETLAETAQRFSVVIHAFCLMPNHYHLLLQTPHANLSAAAGWLQTTYSVRFNRRHRRNSCCRAIQALTPKSRSPNPESAWRAGAAFATRTPGCPRRIGSFSV